MTALKIQKNTILSVTEYILVPPQKQLTEHRKFAAEMVLQVLSAAPIPPPELTSLS